MMLHASNEDKIELLQLARTYCFVWSDGRYLTHIFRPMFKNIIGTEFSNEQLYNYVAREKHTQLLTLTTGKVNTIISKNNSDDECLFSYFLGFLPNVLAADPTITKETRSLFNQRLENYVWNTLLPHYSDEQIEDAYSTIMANVAGGRIEGMFMPQL